MISKRTMQQIDIWDRKKKDFKEASWLFDFNYLRKN
jgi:hypothetical protein